MHYHPGQRNLCVLHGEGMNSRRIVDRQWGMVCLERNWNLLVTGNTELCCHKLFCVMTTLDVTWRQWLLKQIEYWSTRLSLTWNAVQILSYLITIFLYSVLLCGNWFFKRRDQGHGADAASSTTERILCWSFKMLLYRRYSKLHRYLKITVFLLCAFCRIKNILLFLFIPTCGWVRKYPWCIVLKQTVQL
jgi:hypothetical protein